MHNNGEKAKNDFDSFIVRNSLSNIIFSPLALIGVEIIEGGV